VGGLENLVQTANPNPNNDQVHTHPINTDIPINNIYKMYSIYNITIGKQSLKRKA